MGHMDPETPFQHYSEARAFADSKETPDPDSTQQAPGVELNQEPGLCVLKQEKTTGKQEYFLM